MTDHCLFYPKSGSGHARGKDLFDLVKEIDAKMLFPVHTEYPDVYKKITRNITLIDVEKKYLLG